MSRLGPRTLARVAGLATGVAGLALLLWLGARIGLRLADPAPPSPDAAPAPVDDPLERYGLEWTEEIRWAQVVNIADFAGGTAIERLEMAQAALPPGGGVVFFPPGVYEFDRTLRLRDGVVLRGAHPEGGRRALDDDYRLPTRFEFPRFVPSFEGQGTPVESAFKGIHLENPERASNVGVVHIELRFGHIYFAEAPDHAAGRNRFVVGCVVRSAVVASPAVPDPSIDQLPWQRYTDRTRAAIHVFTGENALVADNRLPPSAADNFRMPGYRLLGRGPGRERTVVTADVVFDYENRPGIFVNPYDLGGRLDGDPPDASPSSHPHAFRGGLVIRDNFVYSSGRPAILFTGDGTVAAGNVVRFRPGVIRWTITGRQMAWGDDTNSTRAIEMRGWRWRIQENEFDVHRNRAADSGFLLNDGEGILHEAHANSTVRGSMIVENRGNAPISVYKSGEISGLELLENDVRIDRPEISNATAAIFVMADRESGPSPCADVRIVDNRTRGLGILLACHPGRDNVIADNEHRGAGGSLVNHADAALDDNRGYEVLGDGPPPRIR